MTKWTLHCNCHKLKIQHFTKNCLKINWNKKCVGLKCANISNYEILENLKVHAPVVNGSIGLTGEDE